MKGGVVTFLPLCAMALVIGLLTAPVFIVQAARFALPKSLLPIKSMSKSSKFSKVTEEELNVMVPDWQAREQRQPPAGDWLFTKLSKARSIKEKKELGSVEDKSAQSNAQGKAIDDGGDDIVYRSPEAIARRKTTREERMRKKDEKKRLQQQNKQARKSRQEQKKRDAEEASRAAKRAQTAEKPGNQEKEGRQATDVDRGKVKKQKRAREGRKGQGSDVDETSHPMQNTTRSTQQDHKSNQEKEEEDPRESEIAEGQYAPATSNETAAPPTMMSMPNIVVMRAPAGPLRKENSLPPSETFDPSRAMMVAAAAPLVSNIVRWWLLIWIARRVALHAESMNPEQHFVWECLNDRYNRDSEILNRTMRKPPTGVSALEWRRHLRRSRKGAGKLNPPSPSKTVVVVDVTPNDQLNLKYLNDVVTFLVTAHQQKSFGDKPEIVLLLHSAGGSVSSFGLAAAQVARLQDSGFNVTSCVDAVAASGGYMMASQSNRILAAPFAHLGSIGVMVEGLNFNKVLNDYGVKPLVLKAGDAKNVLSTVAPVTDSDIKEETARLEEIHDDFIQLCLSRRPDLDTSACDGRVLSGARALSSGLVDRLQTSDEYIWEKIVDGSYVLKLHKSTQDRDWFLGGMLKLLPYVRAQVVKLKNLQFVNSPNFSNVAQGVAAAVAIYQMFLSKQS